MHYLESLSVLAPIWLPRPLTLLEAVPAKLMRAAGATDILCGCGVVKASLLEVLLEVDGVTIEPPPSVFLFLSANTLPPELLDLFLPVVAADGIGNLMAGLSD